MRKVCLLKSQIGFLRPPPLFTKLKYFEFISFLLKIYRCMINNTNLCFIWNVVPTSRNQSPRATIWSKYWRLTSIAGAFRLRDDNGPHCFFSPRKIFPILYGMFVFYFFIRYYAIEGALSIEYWALNSPFQDLQPFFPSFMWSVEEEHTKS